MPAKTSARKAAARKPAKRSAKPAKTRSKKNSTNSVQAHPEPAPLPPVSMPPPGVPESGLRDEIERLKTEARAREAELHERIAAQDQKLADAGKPDPVQAQQMKELQSRLTTRQAELEAARAEAANLRDSVAKLRGPGEKANLRCPRCGGHMTETDHESVKADRCDQCHGIFFDNGELERVIQHHDKQRDAGKKGFFGSLFGKK